MPTAEAAAGRQVCPTVRDVTPMSPVAARLAPDLETPTADSVEIVLFTLIDLLLRNWKELEHDMDKLMMSKSRRHRACSSQKSSNGACSSQKSLKHEWSFLDGGNDTDHAKLLWSSRHRHVSPTVKVQCFDREMCPNLCSNVLCM